MQACTDCMKTWAVEASRPQPQTLARGSQGLLSREAFGVRTASAFAFSRQGGVSFHLALCPRLYSFSWCPPI
jgi:hypothetical protein